MKSNNHYTAIDAVAEIRVSDENKPGHSGPGFVRGAPLWHDELKEHVDVGLTPYRAQRTATVNAAEYLGESERAGTITIGKTTDLLLVDANPLADISAASKISGVLTRGQWIPRSRD